MSPDRHAEPAALEEVGVQLEALEAHAADYIRAVLRADCQPGRVYAPRRPASMHPLIAQALRDIARDSLAAVHRYGPTTTNH